MAELDPAELATVLDSAERYLSDEDWDGAYNLLHPVSEANATTGADLGRVNFYLGEACMGLNSYRRGDVVLPGGTREPERQ